MNRTLGSRLAAVIAVAILGTLAPRHATAMPNFSRQYGVPCSLCHTVIPRLTREGYDFRRAGFRMPEDLGKDGPSDKNRGNQGYNMADHFSARLQANVGYTRRNHATATGGYSPGDSTFENFQVEFTEFTLYPLTGSFAKNWASEAEISGTTDEIEVENAYVRYARGEENQYWQARIGIFHPFEGYGASDRVLGLSRPLIQTATTKNGLGATNGYKVWGFDQAGVEWGFQAKGTSLSVMLFNGLIENATDPAQGAGLTKASGSPTQNDKDIQLFANQFLGGKGAAVCGFYYHGHISLGAEDELYQNDFDRYAGYLTVPIEKFWLLAGVGGGREKAAGTDVKPKSMGWFAEADYYASHKLGLGGRYEQFDPSNKIDNNNTKQGLLYVNYALHNGLQTVAEFKNKVTEKGSTPNQTENSINLRFIYIW